MIRPGRLDLVVQRWTPFDWTARFAAGLDFANAEMRLQARLRVDAPGDPIIDLSNAEPPSEGLSMSVSTNDAGQVVSILRIIIEEETCEPILLNAGKAGADVVLAYDLHLTGGGLAKTRLLEGALIIRGGATQND